MSKLRTDRTLFTVCMGIIAADTPAANADIPVPRCSTTAADVENVGKINILFYKAAADNKVRLASGQSA